MIRRDEKEGKVPPWKREAANIRLPLPFPFPLSTRRLSRATLRSSHLLRMKSSSSSSSSSYDAAVVALNSLQSNAAVIAEKRREREKDPDANRRQTEKFLRMVGYEPEALDQLRPIHVAGTKGKGSTCAFTESILRRHGLRTGFFSSPHLCDVRERIRLDGEPLSESLFAKHFWRVWEILEASGEPLPAYFKFLTVLAYVVFMEESVDVALVEVGIGGAHDCTNILRRPTLTAITTLDYDHCSILGHSIQEIAWNKAGIFKPEALALTVPQPPEALAVIEEEARRAGVARLGVVLASHDDEDIVPGIPGPQQRSNVALAVQLAHLWLATHSEPPTPLEPWEQRLSVVSPKSGDRVELSVVPGLGSLSALFRQGLEECRWGGRSQRLVRGTTTFLLDGAHTPKSIELCAEWLKGELEGLPASTRRLLLFHCTADRDAATLLPPLAALEFETGVFSPPCLQARLDPTSSHANFMFSRHSQTERCEKNAEAWAALRGGKGNGETFDCIADALAYVERLEGPKAVAVTGSLHLVGGVIRLLRDAQPD